MSMMMRRDPFETTLTPLREAMNRLFEESFIGPRFEFLSSRPFSVDIYESEDQQKYIVEAALPGVKPDEVQITAMGDTLTIRVTKKQEEKDKQGNYVRRERFEGEMVRSITLPTLIDADKVQASFENGILTLNIPKAEGSKPKQIPIKTTVGTR